MSKPKYRITGDAQELREVIPELTGYDRFSYAFYSSPEALADHAKKTSKESCWASSPWTNSQSFTGTKDMTQACKMAADGWPEGAEIVARLRDKINAMHPFTRQLSRYGVAGAYPNVPRYLAGNPAHMKQIANAASRRKPVITLLSDMSVNGGVDASAITNRAAVVAAIVDAVEAAGFACQLLSFSSSAAGGVHQLCAISIKESHQPADAGRMAFGLGHASMFRRLAWVPIVEDTFTHDLGSGLGCATALPTDKLAERNIYILESAARHESYFRNEERAATDGLNSLIENLRQQGCPAFPQQEAA